MTSSDVRRRPGEETGPEQRAGTDRESASGLAESLRRGVGSGAVAGLGGGLVLLSGLRALRRGQWGRGIVRLFAGGLLIAVGVRQRRSAGARAGPKSGVDQEDVVDTSPDIEHVDRAGLDRDEQASGEVARDVAESSVDVEDATGEEGTAATGARGGDEPAEVGIDFAADVDEPREGIGSGTYDVRRGVPAPEPAFEEGFLELDGEAFWAIREADDAVFVSRRRSVFEESDGVEYVTGSEVDDEQVLSVPDAILDHWEGVDEAEPVSDADELVFATTDHLRRVDVLWVVSEHRTGEFDDL